MADRLIDRLWPFMTNEAREAMLRLAGNFDKNLSENLLKAWAEELDGVDPAAFVQAVNRCIHDEGQGYFPRWAEFAKHLPAKPSEKGHSRAWWTFTGEYGGCWPEHGRGLPKSEVDRLTEIRDSLVDYDKRQQKLSEQRGGRTYEVEPGRLVLIGHLSNLIDGLPWDFDRPAQFELERA